MARKPNKPRGGKGRLGRVLQFLCVVAILAAMTVGATVFFQVEQILVTGNSRYSEAEIIAATGIKAGDNLFRMNKFAIQDRVKKEMPYLEDILIRRALPNTITITVTEWDAVARVLPNPDYVPPEPERDENGELVDPDAHIPAAAEESWLISVGGKLLEAAPEDSEKAAVTGLTALDADAGLQLTVPEEERARLSALLELLGELETQGLLADVDRLEMGELTVVLEYLGRYDVKLPLNGDFAYLLESLLAAVADRERATGPETTGTFDLTQKHYTVVYSPKRLG